MPQTQHPLDISRWTKYVKSRGTTIKCGDHAFILPTVNQTDPEGVWASSLTQKDAGLWSGDAGRALVPKVRMFQGLFHLNTIVDLIDTVHFNFAHHHSTTEVNGDVSQTKSLLLWKTDLSKGCQMRSIDQSESSVCLKREVELCFSHTTSPNWTNYNDMFAIQRALWKFIADSLKSELHTTKAILPCEGLWVVGMEGLSVVVGMLMPMSMTEKTSSAVRGLFQKASSSILRLAR